MGPLCVIFCVFSHCFISIMRMSKAIVIQMILGNRIGNGIVFFYLHLNTDYVANTSSNMHHPPFQDLELCNTMYGK